MSEKYEKNDNQNSRSRSCGRLPGMTSSLFFGNIIRKFGKIEFENMNENLKKNELELK